MTIPLRFTLNSTAIQVQVEPGERLIDLLRERLGLTGTKEGCGEGECGACTVLVDERPVNACLFPACEVDGLEVTTIEGLGGPGNQLSTLQNAFVNKGAIQCGFCSPGMIVSAQALMNRSTEPSDPQIRQALTGNLCRCTGYVQIHEAVREACDQRKKEASR